MNIINTSQFESEVLKAKEPVLVDFFADWCGPCKALSPTLETISKEFGPKAKIVKVNVDNDPDLATQYGIRSIPALLFFKDGEIKASLLGNQSKSVIVGELDKLAQ